MNPVIDKGLPAVGRAAAESALLLPVLAIIAAALVPHSAETLWMISYPLVYMAAFGIGCLLPVRRMYQLLLGSLLLAGLQAFLTLGPSLAALAGAAPAFLLAYRGLSSASRDWRDQFPAPHRITAMSLYLVVYVILLNIGGDYDRYIPLLTWSGLAVFLYLMFDINRTTLRDQSYSANGRVEPGILAQNRTLLVILLAAALVVALFQTIRDLFLRLRDQIAAWLAGIRPSPPRPQETPPAGGQQPQLPVGEEKGSPAWMHVLERIVEILVYALLAALAVWALYRLFRILPRYLNRLYAWLTKRRDREAAAGGYDDDVESLLHASSLNKRLSDLLRSVTRRWSGPKWAQLTDNRARIRYLYGLWLRRSAGQGYGFKPQLTPSETAADVRAWSAAHKAADQAQERQTAELAQVYDRVRYGTAPAGDEEVRRLRELVEGKKS